MSRDWQTYLADIATACDKIISFTAGMSREAFFGDDRTFHAVIHCLLIVGEAVKHIPDEVRQRMPDIEWRKITGMRNFLAHVYFAIDDDIIWDVVQVNVPELLRAVEAFKKEDLVDP
jgi:uncharacterized protein with HEPN domain